MFTASHNGVKTGLFIILWYELINYYIVSVWNTQILLIEQYSNICYWKDKLVKWEFDQVNICWVFQLSLAYTNSCHI